MQTANAFGRAKASPYETYAYATYTDEAYAYATYEAQAVCNEWLIKYNGVKK